MTRRHSTSLRTPYLCPAPMFSELSPATPEQRWLYPREWTEMWRPIRFGRANGRCEHGHRPHGQRVFHVGDGRWWDMDRGQWRVGRGRRIRVGAIDLVAIVRIPRVYIAFAHLNHDPTDNAPHNLAALRHRCHMIHDADVLPLGRASCRNRGCIYVKFLVVAVL